MLTIPKEATESRLEEHKHSKTRLDRLRRQSVHYLVEPVVIVLEKLRVHPNTVTIVGLAIVIVGAYLITLELFWIAGIVVALGSITDVFDGALARKRNMATVRGAFLDAIVDRLQEMAIFIGILIYFIYGYEDDYDLSNRLPIIMLFVALFGSMMISYARARAEGLKEVGSAGLVTRTERIIIIVLFLFIGRLDWLAWVLAIATILGTMWRIAVIWFNMYRKRL